MSAKLKRQALQLVAEQPLSLRELAEKMDLKEKRAYRILKSLFGKGQIASFRDRDNERRYRAAETES